MMVRWRLTVLVVLAFAACGGEDEPNERPVAAPDFATGDEDTPITIDVLANDTDPEGSPLHLVKAVADGQMAAVVDGRVVVTTEANWNGELDVVYTISDGDKTALGHATVTVTPVNDAPTAKAAVIATGRNEAKHLHLEGWDIDGDAVTFEVQTSPAHGTLTGVAPDLIYTPNTGYVGDDSIPFIVRDATSASSTATISITVSAGAAPRPTAQTVFVLEDATSSITLAATDADHDPITFTITQQPAHGTLTGTPPNMSYVPFADYNGVDIFKFVASDGLLTSLPADVTINVTPQNDPPLAKAQTIAATEDQLASVTLSGSDIDGDPLTFTIVTPPTRGTLTGAGAARTYQPTANLNGADSFTFTVSDGTTTSAPATVALNVAAVQDPPTATQQTVSATEDSARAIVLSGTDPDGDTLAFAVASNPAHGALIGTPPAVTYVPAANFNGSDSFTFTVTDGQAVSAPVAVSLNVVAVDDAPTITGAALSGNEGANISIPLPSTDIDGDILTYAISTPPAKGTITGAGGWVFNSGNGNGNITFALTASDGRSTSAPATFTVAVTPVPDAPVAHDDIGVANVNQTLRVSPLANDEEVDGDTLSLQSVGTPLHGTIALDGDDFVYTTAPGNVAPDKVTYTVVDSTGLTSVATVFIGIGEMPTGMPTRFVDQAIDAGSSFNQSLQQDISRDGRYVAFTSKAALTAGDTNGASDVYLFDRVTFTRERISVPTGGGVADGASERPSISADGRYIAFASAATNLVPNDTNGVVDVFVRDRVSGTTKRVSVSSTGAQVTGASRDPDISADGSIVAFASNAFELVPNDANGAADIFVRDLKTETTTRVSVRVDGGEADQLSVSPVLSDDGDVVAFISASTNLVPNDANGKADVFVRIRSTNTTERVSVSSTGIEANAASSGRPALSADGRFVAFISAATNFIPGSSVGGIFVRDRQALTTVLGAASAASLWLSGDGRYLVTASSSGTALIRDRFVNQTVSLSSSVVFYPVISANGRYLAVLSTADLDSEAHGAGTKVFIMPNPL